MRKLGKRKIAAILTIALAVILVLIVPLVIPDGISIASFEPTMNPIYPITTNPGFEQGMNSWSISRGPNSTMEVVSGEGFTGSHSIYINAPPGDIMTNLFYLGNQTLPLDINSSTFFSFYEISGCIVEKQFCFFSASDNCCILFRQMDHTSIHICWQLFTSTAIHSCK